MKQSALDLRLEPPRTFVNFVTGQNPQLLVALHTLCASPGTLYLWGDRACGKTHLLDASAGYARHLGRQVIRLDGAEVGEDIEAPNNTLVIVDDVETLSADGQIALFTAWVRQRERQLSLLVSGQSAPRELQVREDLRTRIGQAQLFAVQPLDDRAKIQALRQHARAIGLKLTDDLLLYLLKQGLWDFGTMLAIIDELDRRCLEEKRTANFAMIRDAVQVIENRPQ